MDTKQNLEILKQLMNSQQQQAIEARRALVEHRTELCKRAIRRRSFPITRTAHYFTYSERHGSIPKGAFILIFVKLECPNRANYYELSLEFVGKGEPLQVLSFFTTGPFFKDQTDGDARLNEFIRDIILILSELRFEPDVFLRIARILVPRWYEVTMHLDQEHYDYIEQFQRFNPFSVPVDFFSLSERPVKRVRIQQFVAEDLEVNNVVEEELNKNPNKKRKI